MFGVSEISLVGNDTETVRVILRGALNDAVSVEVGLSDLESVSCGDSEDVLDTSFDIL